MTVNTQALVQNAATNILKGAQSANGDIAKIESVIKSETTTLVEALANTNPLAGMLAGLIVPQIVNGLVDAAFAFFAHVEQSAPAWLHDAKAALDNITHGVL